MALAAFGFPPFKDLLADADGVVMVVLFADVDCEEPAATETKAPESNEINHNKTTICNRNNWTSGHQSSAAWQQRTGESVLLYSSTTRQLLSQAWTDDAGHARPGGKDHGPR